MPVEAGGGNGATAGGGRPSAVSGGPATAPASVSAAPRSGFAGGPGAAGASPESLHAAILADAAIAWRLADPAVLRVVQSEAVTWPDGAIGCPQPGTMYTQALVPGWRFVVSDGQRFLVYHASQRGAWVWCPPARAALPLPSGGSR